MWGDVITASFATEEGAFLRGQIRMEEQVDIGEIAQPLTEIAPSEDDKPPPNPEE